MGQINVFVLVKILGNVAVENVKKVVLTYFWLSPLSVAVSVY